MLKIANRKSFVQPSINEEMRRTKVSWLKLKLRERRNVAFAWRLTAR